MRDELRHRGPDGAGIYMADDERVALGHRRLSIIDLSSAADQPLPNEDESVWLVFNGEIYNYRELRSELEAEGHEFRSDTDSEVIVHGYEEWGVDCVERFRGMFAFAVWDENNERFFLARDRLGIKPLYYLEDAGRFLFASELKAILADKAIEREIDPDGLRHYLKYRYVPAPLTIWRGITKLEAGCHLVYEEGEAEIERYWSPYDHVDEVDSEQAALDETEEKLFDAVASHLVSDVPIGSLLSGGLDSSIVSAIASGSMDGLRAHSIGFEPEHHGELEFAQTVSETFDISLQVSKLSIDTVDELLDEILYYYDEPISDTSIFPTYLLMREVSSDVKVALSGDGGDEVFAGYTWYDRYISYQKFDSLSYPLSISSNLLLNAATRTNSNLMNAVGRRLLPFEARGIERYNRIMDSPFREETMARLLTEEFYSEGERDVQSQYARDTMSVKDLQLLDMKTFLPEDILTKVDRASMANSLEVRVPLLDHELVEQVLSLTEERIYKDGGKKHILKRIGDDILPESILERRKSGFSAPMKALGFVEKYGHVLRESRAAEDGIFQSEELADVPDSEIGYNKKVRLILFELWYREWRTPAGGGSSDEF